MPLLALCLVNQPSGNQVMSHRYLWLRMPDLNHSELSWLALHNLGFSATTLFTDRQSDLLKEMCKSEEEMRKE